MKRAHDWRLPGRRVAVKAIVLGSVAALAVTGAEAAGLSINDSVDYVRLCDRYVTGYWSLAGPNGCINLPGKKLKFKTRSETKYGVFTSSSKLQFKGGDGQLGVTLDRKYKTRSETKWGVLTSFTKLRVEFDRDDSQLNVTVDRAYAELGRFLAGHTKTTFGYGGAFFGDSLDVDDNVDQVRVTWANDGFKFMLGIEDPVDRWGSDISFGMPDIVGALNLKRDGWDAKFSAGFSDLSDGSAWAVAAGATFDLDSIAKGDEFRLRVGVGSAPAGTGNAFLGCDGGGVCNYAMASLRHFWTSDLSSAITYAFNDNGSDPDSYAVAGNLEWKGPEKIRVGFTGRYISEGGDDEWTGKFKLKRKLK